MRKEGKRKVVNNDEEPRYFREIERLNAIIAQRDSELEANDKLISMYIAEISRLKERIIELETNCLILGEYC